MLIQELVILSSIISADRGMARTLREEQSSLPHPKRLSSLSRLGVFGEADIVAFFDIFSR